MQRKQDGLVPIGEALSGLDGPVKAICEASPQALHHFTRFDQVNQLVSCGYPYLTVVRSRAEGS